MSWRNFVNNRELNAHLLEWKLKRHNRHFYHLVDRSPWPILVASSLFIVVSGLVFWMHRMQFGGYYFLLGFTMLLVCMILWWRDVISEAKNQGNHTLVVQRGLKLGFKLFILSEVMFFSGFFWAFFSASLGPTVWIANMWPPMGFPVMDAWAMPLLNTIILLVSGLSITWAHHSVEASELAQACNGMGLTSNLAMYFLLLQYIEYTDASFELSDGIYGSTFYSLTGLHCFHVIVGLVFIYICLSRFRNGHFSPNHHIGFIFSMWYWHFVDVVWIFLFIFVYVWGNWMPEGLAILL